MKNILSYLFTVLFTLSILNLSAQDCFIGENLNNPYSQNPYSVHQYNGKIYEGGHYHLRRLDNGVWSNFGGGLGGSSISVNSFANYEGQLIIGGQFASAGQETVNNICSWDDNSFSALGSGFNGWINSITVWDGKLVAGGYFETDNLGTTIFNHIAVWDGNTWKPIGGGFTGVTSGFTIEVFKVGVFNGELIATGRFKFANGNTAVNSIARWDGTNWQPFGTGLYSSGIPDGLGIGYSITTYKNNLVVSGWFNEVDGNNINWIASWNGNQWSGFGPGPNRHCLDLEIYKGDLYGAGPLSFEIGGEGYTMAYWDGTSWIGAAQVNANWATDMSVSENDSVLFFCGSFNFVNGFHTTNIAQWICEETVDVADIEYKDEETFTLRNPYPNPFYSLVNIPFVLNKPGTVELSVYTLQGIRVATIIDKHMGAGSHIANWDGYDENLNIISKTPHIIKLNVNGVSSKWEIIIRN